MSMTKIKRTLWLSSFKDGAFGIVEIQTDNGKKEKKYYIWKARWDDEREDAEHIAEWWAPIHPEVIKHFFNF